MKKLTFKQKMLLYDIAIWSGVVIIAIWLVLKMAGLINTSVIITYLPGIVGLFSFSMLLLRAGQYLGRIERDIHYLKRDMSHIKKDVKLNTDFRIFIHDNPNL